MSYDRNHMHCDHQLQSWIRWKTQGMVEIVVPSIIGSLACEGRCTCRYGNLHIGRFEHEHLLTFWDLFLNINPVLVKYSEHFWTLLFIFRMDIPWTVTTSALCRYTELLVWTTVRVMESWIWKTIRIYPSRYFFFWKICWFMFRD